MKTLKKVINSVELNVYQLDKNGKRTFNFIIEGTTRKRKVENINEAIADEFSRDIWAIRDKQESIKAKGGKARFYGLADSKELFFCVDINGEGWVDTDIERLKKHLSFKSIKLADLKADRGLLKIALEGLLDLLTMEANL